MNVPIFVSSTEVCYYDSKNSVIGLCPNHTRLPVYSLVHELCHHDLRLLGISDDIAHILAPHKGLGYGRCKGLNISSMPSVGSETNGRS